MSVVCQKLPQNLVMDQKQAVQRVFLGHNVLVHGPSGSGKTHARRFMHAERPAHFKGYPTAVVALLQNPSPTRRHLLKTFLSRVTFM
jgi:transcriptional regulator with AAA-type ATPase domain